MRLPTHRDDRGGRRDGFWYESSISLPTIRFADCISGCNSGFRPRTCSARWRWQTTESPGKWRGNGAELFARRSTGCRCRCHRSNARRWCRRPPGRSMPAPTKVGRVRHGGGCSGGEAGMTPSGSQQAKSPSQLIDERVKLDAGKLDDRLELRLLARAWWTSSPSSAPVKTGPNTVEPSG